MTFKQAKSRYVHRYTREHIPSWAKTPAPNGKLYAPQFASDREWFENTVFPPNHPLGKKETDCGGLMRQSRSQVRASIGRRNDELHETDYQL